MPVAADLAGRVGFITGGARGIGLGIGSVPADAGMKIAVADVDADELDCAVAQLRAAGAEEIACGLSLAQAKRPGSATPREVGERVLAGIRRHETYILTHLDIMPSVEQRYATLLADFREPAHVD